MMLISERAAYMERAVCLGATDVMYAPDVLINPEKKAEALKKAREACESCPVRIECGEHGMEEEAGMDEVLRSGIRAWLTPAQRISLERRGGLKGRDPMLLAKGYDGKRRVPPIPDDGDQWSRHHTTLARKVVRWLAENVKRGQALPAQEKICDELGCTHTALARVMDALVQDGTLDYSKPGSRTKYVRRRNPSVVGSWLPIHLRHLAVDDEGSPCVDNPK